MSKETILLVEDNPDEAELALLGFRRVAGDYDIEVVSNGEAALDFLFAQGLYSEREASRKPALIILDIALPRLNGFEVLQRLRAEASYSTTPVIMLSSSDEQSDVVKGYQLGINSYLRKPVDFENFTCLLQQICHYWLNLNIRGH